MAGEREDRDAEQGLISGVEKRVEDADETAQSSWRVGKSLHPVFYIAAWIFLSNTTILFNKWLIDNRGFKYPATLTCWHLIFSTIATQILARTTSLLDGRKTVKMTGRVYLRAIVPIGLLYSVSLVCSNMVYLYLSVAFIQVLKSASPLIVLLTAWAWRVEQPSLRRFVNVSVIVFGVALASVGEINFSFIGFLFQLGGTTAEAMRLIMIQILLSADSQKMDPLVSLYYYAPVCAVMNILIAGAAEALTFDVGDIAKAGYGLLFLNAAVAFLLNVSGVFLIGKTSGLVMTLTGIFKSILLVGISVFIWNTSISGLQFVGYGIALAGLTYYSLGWEQIVSLTTGFTSWFESIFASQDSETRLSPGVRKGIIAALAVLITLSLISGFMYSTGLANTVIQLPSKNDSE
ncbi:triose-phosphate transporter family-domain-containing protein [Podospora aff. communis PSN243]|uniref:Triose-phosphate transporter family-domain-containing protein n=1 Tax=Podospora aff. communis PSN243 TaxID=3040156 RepID=A0AAV9GZB6_9PEZI|nr:triose-phosphate transporter family-domain-containing protein [Podospora aff. communis PSN243]